MLEFLQIDMSKARGYVMTELRWVSALYQITSPCKSGFTCLCLQHIYIFLHNYYLRSNKSFPSLFSPLLVTFVIFSSSKFIHSQFILADLLINSLLRV